MRTSAECPYCHKPSRDGLLCQDDVQLGVRTLGEDVPWLLEQLAVATARQSRVGSTGIRRSRSAEQPLPLDVDAGKMLAALERVTGEWAAAFGGGQVEQLLDASRAEFWTSQSVVADPARDVAARTAASLVARDRAARVRVLGDQIETLADGPAGSARWLAGRLPNLRAHPKVAGMLGDVLALAQAPNGDVKVLQLSQSSYGSAWKAIDIPVDLIPLGECGGELIGSAAPNVLPCACSCHHGDAYRDQCDLPGGCASTGCVDGWRPAAGRPVRCSHKLQVEQGQAVVTCRVCKTVHEVRKRRDRAISEHAHIQGRPPRLALILTLAGVPCTVDVIYGYVRRKQITATMVDAAGASWYRLGDVHRLLVNAEGRRHRQEPADPPAAAEVPDPTAPVETKPPSVLDGMLP